MQLIAGQPSWTPRRVLIVAVLVAVATSLAGCDGNVDPSSGGVIVYVDNDTGRSVVVRQCGLPDEEFSIEDGCAGDESAETIPRDGSATMSVLASIVLRVEPDKGEVNCLLVTPGKHPYAEVSVSAAHDCEQVERWVRRDEFRDDLSPSSRRPDQSNP